MNYFDTAIFIFLCVLFSLNFANAIFHLMKGDYPRARPDIKKPGVEFIGGMLALALAAWAGMQAGW